MKVNKKTAVIGGAVVAAAVVYGATRTERGNRVRQQVADKVNLPNTGRIVENVKAATQEGVARVQGVLGNETTSAGHQAATKPKQD